MQPRRVRRVHQPLIRQRFYGVTKQVSRRKKKYKYNVGHMVRISKQRLTFSKGYLPNWSEEIFVIRERRIQREPVLLLARL